MSCMGHNALFEALRRGEDYGRSPGTYSIHPHPPMIGALTTFAPLSNAVLHAPSATPAPNGFAGAPMLQYGVLPKQV